MPGEAMEIELPTVTESKPAVDPQPLSCDERLCNGVGLVLGQVLGGAGAH